MLSLTGADTSHHPSLTVGSVDMRVRPVPLLPERVLSPAHHSLDSDIRSRHDQGREEEHSLRRTNKAAGRG